MKEVKKMRISINLTSDEYNKLKEKAETFHTTVNELLSQFIADLTSSERSGGSDERDKAESWLYRSSDKWSWRCFDED